MKILKLMMEQQQMTAQQGAMDVPKSPLTVPAPPASMPVVKQEDDKAVRIVPELGRNRIRGGSKASRYNHKPTRIIRQ